MTEKDTLAKTIDSRVVVPGAIDEAALSFHLSFCDITGFGNFEWAEIEDSAGSALRLEGPLDLLSLRGRLRHAGAVTVSDYRVLFAMLTDDGLSVVGGRLVGGEATLLELAFSPLQIAQPAGSISASTYRGKRAAEKAGKEKAWATAMDLSSALEKKGDSAHLWEEAPAAQPAQGDVVKHQHFGDCTVVKVGDEHISLQKPDGRIVQLGLRILSFTLRQTEGNKTLWDVSIKR